jgi:heterodisulfide reductase subunit A-like polyferredoxin
MLSEQVVAIERRLLVVDQDLCLGCGQCVRSCPQGALVVRGSAVELRSLTRCRGLGSCLGHCSADALSVVVCHAEPFDGRPGPMTSCVSW